MNKTIFHRFWWYYGFTRGT